MSCSGVISCTPGNVFQFSLHQAAVGTLQDALGVAPAQAGTHISLHPKRNLAPPKSGIYAEHGKISQRYPIPHAQ